MADVTAICKRIIVIHHGSLLFDGSQTQLVRKFSSYKTKPQPFKDKVDLGTYREILKIEGERVSIRVPQEAVSTTTSKILTEYTVNDLTVEDVPIDDVIDQVYAQEKEL